jgi:hypothetical protein
VGHGIDAGKWVTGDVGQVCGSDLVGIRKMISIYPLSFSNTTERELNRGKWLGFSEKYEILPGCRLEHLEQPSC